VRHVALARSHFLRSLDALPPTIASQTRTRIRARLKRDSGRCPQMIGEYAPWLAADIMGVTDVPAIKRVAVAWLYIYFFTLMLDDVIDRTSGEPGKSDYIASCLLLQRGLSHFAQATNAGERFAAALNSAFQKTAKAAMLELASHRLKVRSYS